MGIKAPTNPVIAIIVPCYNEEAVLEISNKVFVNVLTGMINDDLISERSYICYINDGSKDKSWDIISKLMGENSKIRGISFSRNYGHQCAMLAGLKECQADAYITIDADLQEDPSMIKEMVANFCKGYDIVYGVRRSRQKDSWFKRNASLLFYKIMKAIGSETIYNSSEARLVSDRVANYIRKYPEKNIYLRGIISSIGFNYALVEYTRGERAAGESKYPFSKLLAAALDGIITTSIKPLRFIFTFGMCLLGLGLICLLVAAINLICGFTYGWHFFFLFFISSVGAVQLFALSIAGEYIGRIFKEVKNRPSYIIDKNCSDGKEKDL